MITVFDLDHTLFSVNCSFHFGIYLFKQKQLSFFSMIYLLGCYSLHKSGIFSLSFVHKTIFDKFFNGKCKVKTESQAKEFLSIHLESLKNVTIVERLQIAQKNGNYTILMSSSPYFLVKHIAQIFGIDEWYATNYHVNEKNKFCSISEIDGNKKASCLIEIAKKMNVPLSKTKAYSDSILDLPLFKVVGEVVAVNPSNRLQKICKKNHWKILITK